MAFGTWVASLLRTSPLSMLSLTLLVFISYGVWQVGRGVLGGSEVVYTFKFFTFNYYILYMFLGMRIGLHSPDFLRKIIRVVAWTNGIYGIVFLVLLRYLDAYVPGTNVPLFSAPAGQVVVILGLLCFERSLRSVWLILALNILVTLVWQVRPEWAGLASGILVWGVLTGRLGRVIAIGMAGLIVLAALEFADIKLAGRSGDSVSISENLARIVAPINLDLAKQLSPNAKYHAGTAEWRELWWQQIWISVHSTPVLEAFGHGYGFDLYGLAPAKVRSGQEKWEVRTPHSIFYYALGYTGWVGVVMFAALQFAIVTLLWRSYRVTGQAAGLVFWVMTMVRYSFEEGLETPFKAIPVYLLLGIAMAPALRAWPSLDRRPAYPAPHLKRA